MALNFELEARPSMQYVAEAYFKINT